MCLDGHFRWMLVLVLLEALRAHEVCVRRAVKLVADVAQDIGDMSG